MNYKYSSLHFNRIKILNINIQQVLFVFFVTNNNYYYACIK